MGERCGARGGGGEAVRGGWGGAGVEDDVDVDGIVETGGAEDGFVGIGTASAVDVVWPVDANDLASATACRMGEELGVAGVGDRAAAALRSASWVWD